jgi:hypothetical protein
LFSPSSSENVKPETTDGEEEDESAQCDLLGACLDLLAVSGAHAVKGVRDSAKRLWSSILQSTEADSEALDSIVNAVVGNDTLDDGEEGEEGEFDEEVDVQEEEEGSEDEDDEVEEDKDGEEEEEEEMAQIVEDAESSDEGQGSDEEEVLVHNEAADAALANMIQMRKQSRKLGLLQAKRLEFIVRSRAIDLLEVTSHADHV